MIPLKSYDPQKRDGSYDIALAYFLVTGLSLAFLFVIILRRVSLDVHNLTGGIDEGQHPISEIVFASYDHTLLEERSIRLKQLSIAQALMEQVFEQKSKAEYEAKNPRALLRRRICVNIIVLMILMLSFWAIQATVTAYGETVSNSFDQLIPSIVVSLLNQVVPITFEMLARLEQWRTPLQGIVWTVVRSIFLRLGSLYAFFWTYFSTRSSFMVSLCRLR